MHCRPMNDLARIPACSAAGTAPRVASSQRRVAWAHNHGLPVYATWLAPARRRCPQRTPQLQLQSSTIVMHGLIRPLEPPANAILIGQIHQIHKQRRCDETHGVSRRLFIHKSSAALPCCGYRVGNAMSIVSNHWLCAAADHIQWARRHGPRSAWRRIQASSANAHVDSRITILVGRSLGV